VSEHPTPPNGIPSTPPQVSTIEVLARLIDIQRSVEKGNERLETIEKSIGDLKNVDKTLAEGVQALGKRTDALEGRVKALEEDRDRDRRERSEERDARAKETESIIAHVSRLEGSIGDAVREAVQPLADRVAALEKNDAARVLAMRAQDEQLATVVNLLTKLGRWQFPWWAKLALSIGFAIGGAVAGYIAAGGH
jgi:predicted nuclease with TOPRIM domain